jgi:hypothetical protein
MYALPRAPRPIGGVVDDVFHLYRASFSRCWALALIAAVLTGANSLYLQQQLRGLTPRGAATPASAMTLMNQLHALQHSAGVLVSYLAMMLIWVVIRAAILCRQHAVAMGDEDTAGAALGFGLRRLPSMIGAGIVWALAIGVGMLLLLIPGIWLWGRFELWLAALCVEDLGPLKALGRSWQLIEGNWWRATTIMTVVLIIIMVLSLTGGAVVGVVVGVSHGNLPSINLASTLVTAVINIFTIPILTAAMLSIYYDCKLRREGGDLAVRLSALQPA